MDSLENHQALAKQFALILDFVLAFDDLKVLFLIYSSLKVLGSQRSNIATRTYPIVKRNIDSRAYIVKRIT